MLTIKHPYDNKKYFLSTQRSLTKRGVLWVGLKCDLKCIFCYDAQYNKKKKEWIPINELKKAVDKIKFFYKNEFIDFMGGEPTIYPKIFELIKYCSDIKLHPTCITHGLHLSDFNLAEKFKEAGINDFLISIHAIGEVSDRIFGLKNKNSVKKQIQAFDNLIKLEIPFRCNITITKLNLKQLSDIALTCIDHGCLIINYIIFNPYFEWEKINDIWFQAEYNMIKSELEKAVNVCTRNNIEVNIRYLPICIMKGREEFVYTNYQLPYDMHEWDFNSWYDLGFTENLDKNDYFKLSEIQSQRFNYIKGSCCLNCSARNICDGFHAQYVNRWGFKDANPYSGELIKEPTFFIKKQKKLFYESIIKNDDVTYNPQQLTLSQYGKKDYRAGSIVEKRK